MTEKNVLAKNDVLIANVGEDIGLELGMKLVKDHFDATGDKTCHFIGKDILNRMLNQPDCMGINIYKALNERKEQTYVLVGIDQKGEPILDYPIVNVDGQLSRELGIVADRVGTKGGWMDL